MSITQIAVAIAESEIGTAIRESLILFPLIEGIHLLGLALSFGLILFTDLRLIGVFMPNVPISQILGQLRRLVFAGFFATFLTGFLLFWAEADTMIENPAFLWKLGSRSSSTASTRSILRATGLEGAPIRQGHEHAIAIRLAVLRAVALDLDQVTGLDVFLRQATVGQRVRCAEFHTPVGDLAVRSLDIEVQPAVRIHPLGLGDDALQLDGLLGIEFRGEGVMGIGRRGCEQRGADGAQACHAKPVGRKPVKGKPVKRAGRWLGHAGLQ